MSKRHRKAAQAMAQRYEEMTNAELKEYVARLRKAVPQLMSDLALGRREMKKRANQPKS